MANSKVFGLPNGDVAFAAVPIDPRNGAARLSITDSDIQTGGMFGLTPVSIGAFVASIAQSPATTVVEDVARTLLASAAGVAMTIRSLSASDVGPVVRIYALGANYAELAPFDVTLNGTSTVSLLSATPMTRINHMERVSGDFVGNVLVENGGVTYGAIAAGQHTQRSSQFTVPAGKRLYVTDAVGALTKGAAAGTSVSLSFQLKPSTSTTFGSYFDVGLPRDGSTLSQFKPRFIRPFTGPCDLRVLSSASAASLDVQTYVTGILQDV